MLNTYANDIPHYEVRWLADFYISGAPGSGSSNITVYLESTFQYLISYTSSTLLNYGLICRTSSSDFQIRTYIIEATH